LIWDLYKVSIFASWANLIHKKNAEQENLRLQEEKEKARVALNASIKKEDLFSKLSE
jgi:hypothetical protein